MSHLTKTKAHVITHFVTLKTLHPSALQGSGLWYAFPSLGGASVQACLAIDSEAPGPTLAAAGQRTGRTDLHACPITGSSPGVDSLASPRPCTSTGSCWEKKSRKDMSGKQGHEHLCCDLCLVIPPASCEVWLCCPRVLRASLPPSFLKPSLRY